MSFASGAATFNSCNKPGSIVEFTNHLRMHPGDYNALMWRAKAYAIVGQPRNAMADIEHAISVSSGIKREVATAKKFRNSLTSANFEDYRNHVRRTVERYPNEWTAWKELADVSSVVGDKESQTRCNMKSLELAARFNETRDPEICWVNFEVGKYWMEKGDTDTAKGYYEAAIKSSPTHTVSHMMLCNCNIIQGNLQSARECFQTAKSLNPTLASQVFETENFDVYSSRYREERRQQHISASSSGNRDSTERQATGQTGGGGRGGGRGGSGGGGNGSGSDNDDKDVSDTWKRLQKEAPSIKRYGGHKYVQSKCGNYWYSRDTARHGGAEFKRYEDTGSTLRFKDSLDANCRPMTSKHESRHGTCIKKSDMTGVK